MSPSPFPTWKRLFLLLLTQAFLSGCTANREASRSTPDDGRMVVKCVITTRGIVTHCRMLENGSVLAGEALLSLHLRRFEPVRIQGRPVHADYTFKIQVKPPAADASSSPSSESSTEPGEKELRGTALFLCRHQMLDAPVTSRLPPLVNPSLLIRPEALRFLQENPSSVPLTELDRRNLYADLAPFVSCEVTDVRVSQDVAVVSLQRSSPSWEDLPLDSREQLGSLEALKRLGLLERWVQEKATSTSPSAHQLRFVKTPKGWLADYQLPEGARP